MNVVVGLTASGKTSLVAGIKHHNAIRAARGKVDMRISQLDGASGDRFQELTSNVITGFADSGQFDTPPTSTMAEYGFRVSLDGLGLKEIQERRPGLLGLLGFKSKRDVVVPLVSDFMLVDAPGDLPFSLRVRGQAELLRDIQGRLRKCTGLIFCLDASARNDLANAARLHAGIENILMQLTGGDQPSSLQRIVFALTKADSISEVAEAGELGMNTLKNMSSKEVLHDILFPNAFGFLRQAIDPAKIDVFCGFVSIYGFIDGGAPNFIHDNQGPPRMRTYRSSGFRKWQPYQVDEPFRILVSGEENGFVRIMDWMQLTGGL